MAERQPAIPAATLILMREGGGGAPELLMVERSEHMAFAAGALAFPGGRIDDADLLAAEALADGGALAAARIAALRETIEETGVASAIAPDPREDQVKALRERLLAGDPLHRLLAEGGLVPDLEALVPFARWCPNFKETRRFDATFFVARAPDGTGEPTPQAGEIARCFWARAADLLVQLDTGQAHAIFPTRRNLERLARFASFDEAAADAGQHEVRTITPWVEWRDGREWVCIPEGMGYPVTAELLETARRR